MPPALDLPDDIQTLKQLLLEERAARQVDRAEIASLKLQLSYLKRQQYGQSLRYCPRRSHNWSSHWRTLRLLRRRPQCRRQSRRGVRRA